MLCLPRGAFRFDRLTSEEMAATTAVAVESLAADSDSAAADSDSDLGSEADSDLAAAGSAGVVWAVRAAAAGTSVPSPG